MTRQQELTEKLLDYTLKPHRLVNVARRFSINRTATFGITQVSGTYTWNNYYQEAMQRIGEQRIAEIPSATDVAFIQYELNGRQGSHARVEKVAGAQFYMENVPAGATVGIWAILDYDTSSGHPQVELISAPIKEGLNKLTFDEVECSYFELNFTGLAGQTQYLRYAVPLGYADSIDDVHYHQITPIINPGASPVPMSQVRSFQFPDEQFSQTHIGGSSNLRNPSPDFYAVFEQPSCSFSVYTNTWTIEDERMVCGIKLRARADLKARLTIVAWSYNAYNPTILADGVEFLQDIVLWFQPTPACQLDFFFEVLNPIPGSYTEKALDFLETFCINIPGENEVLLTPVSVESIKGAVPVINTSATAALNIKPLGKADGVSTDNVALASAGSTAAADSGTDVDCPAQQAIDGLANLDWISWGPGFGWLEINFNSLRYITRLVINYEYMPTDWVIEGMDENNAWITIATESRPEGYYGEITYDFSPVKLTKIRYRSTVAYDIHAIYEIEAYEVNMVDAPLPVALTPVNRAVVTDTVTNAALDTTISGTAANWKLVFLGLKFTAIFAKDYTISIKHVPTGTEYNLIQQIGSDRSDELITAPLNLTSDFEIHVATSVLGVGETAELVAITEAMP